MEQTLKDSIVMGLLKKILSVVERNTGKSNGLYNNQDVMQMLHVKDKFLKKLRDNGFIGYTRVGDKYWYTQKDIDDFLNRFHYAPFASDTSIPPFIC